jgi:hypothetical protein
MIEHRYEERGDNYLLRSWPDDASEQVLRGGTSDRPVWLSDVITLATIGEHISNVASPPPDRILWFTTDGSGALKEFLSFGAEVDPAKGFQFGLWEDV